MKIQRKTLTGEAEAFTFDVKGKRFLVKNFSDSDAYAAFDAEATEGESAKIPANTAQVVMENEFLYEVGDEGTDTIYVTATGEIEVQMIWY